jgi:spermidine/putrescine transport system substrate-binding protein
MLRLLLLLMLASTSLLVHADDKELVVLNWADYLDPEVVGEFEKAYGVKVKQLYYESDAERDKIMAKEDGKGFDVVVVDQVTLAVYAKQGWLAPLPKLTNLNNLDEKWQQDFTTRGRYGLAYFWGTMGLAYRADLVDEPIHSWMQVFRPARKLSGRIIMINDSLDLIGMALKALGYSMNSQDPHQLQQAEQLLLAQRPSVKRYGYVLLDKTSALVTGKAYVSMAFSGDALALQELEPNIRYVVPDEGGSLWTDYLAITASGNQKLAASFIDFLNRSDMAARNASFVYYASPNRAAREQLDEDYLTNPVIFPDAKTLARCESNQPLPPRVMRQYNMVYARVVDKDQP